MAPAQAGDGGRPQKQRASRTFKKINTRTSRLVQIKVGVINGDVGVINGDTGGIELSEVRTI